MPDDPPAEPQPVRLRIVFCATPLAVRQVLHRLIADLEGRGIPAEARSAAEIVLAEALNNVVEHAYAEATGEIEFELAPEPDGLRCSIVDHGSAMPELRLPEGTLPAGDEPAEGGFGWFLIRSLARDLRYDRIGGTNRLSFSLPATLAPDNPTP